MKTKNILINIINKNEKQAKNGFAKKLDKEITEQKEALEHLQKQKVLIVV